jgi:DNA-binding transcriptional LysR family regulator
MLPDLNDLHFFAKVVDENGFAAAARNLGIPRSRLSRRIGVLEQRVGVRLIQRSTRHFAVTDIGREYYRHCVAVRIEAEAAQEVIDKARAEPRGVVRMSCPSPVLDFQVGEMIARFMAKYPKVDIHVESTNRRVDVLREGFDLAVRVRFPPLEETDLVVKKLADSPQQLVASPALLKGRAVPLVPTDLGTLPGMAWSPSPQDHEWLLHGPDNAIARIPYKPRFITEDMVALRLAALHGVGVVRLPTIVVNRDVSEGRLVDVLPGWAPKPGIIHAVFPSRRGLLPSLRTLLDFMGTQYVALSRTDASLEA